MANEHIQRRLAAILAADVVGYSRLMERDETSTLTGLKARWKEVPEPLVERHRGRRFQRMGDGVPVELSSAVSAVQCAAAPDRQRAVQGKSVAGRVDPGGRRP